MAARRADLASRRITELHRTLTALDNLRLWVQAEIERWERIAAGKAQDSGGNWPDLEG